MLNDPPRTGGSLWLDRFFEAYFRARPVNATFMGVHAFDHLLPDYSEKGSADAIAEMERLLREAPSGEPGLDPVEALDVRLASGFLRIQLWEYRSTHFQRGNPSTYTGEAVFSLLSLFLTDYAPLRARVEAAVSRMEAFPRFFDAARQNLSAAPPGWTARALRECRGCIAFLTEGVVCLEAEGDVAPAFRRTAERAAEAVRRFASFLTDELEATSLYASGGEALALYVREGHFLKEAPNEIARYAESQLLEARAHLEEHARDFGAATPEEALSGLGEIRTQAECYYDRYRILWNDVRATVEANDLLTWPESPIRYEPVPAWARPAAPDLYFLPYRAPAPFQTPAVHRYLVEPLDPGMSLLEKDRVLASQNESAIKLNHVVHHGSVGHHVQNARAANARSRVGRVAGVDCAARIALFCGGTMAEGWACYATDLMAEHGFLSPLERYAERRTRSRMCARAVVDVRLHEGRLTLDEAAAYYMENAGMPEAAARAEVVKNSMFPGAALMYVAGTDAIHSLRRELSLGSKGAFSLRAFHDEFLSWGCVPVALVAESMRRHHAQ